jgi:hypothetical protein
MTEALETLIQKKQKEIHNDIDDYTDNVYAILGFCNLWSYDKSTGKSKPSVKVFQGRRLTSLTSSNITLATSEVTPDLGIVINDNEAILGEIKKNFPKDDSDDRQKEIFAQLKQYDQPLSGWPTPTETVNSHELALLVHQMTSMYANDYFSTHNREINFNHAFCIVSFNRVDQGDHHFFFQLIGGNPGCSMKINGTRLHYGIAVPMHALLEAYSKSKIYDAMPPLPYLLNLIWENVFTQIATENPKFLKLKRNSKLDIQVKIDYIVKVLQDSFSFQCWHKDFPDRQPLIPKREWIDNACQFLVDSQEALWLEDKQELQIHYHKLEKTLDHFIRLVSESLAKKEYQPSMFDLNAGEQ